MRDWKDLGKLYIDDNLSTIEIARMKGVKPPTVLYHLHRQNIKVKPRNWRRMKILPTHPSPSFSYVIGALFGDGWVSKDPSRARIQLRVKSRPFVELFSDHINQIGLHAFITSTKSGFWVSTAKSIRFVKWWHETSDFQILDIALTYPREYLCGLFDAEGSVFQRECDKAPRISIDCGNALVMMSALAILKKDRFNCYSTVYELPSGKTMHRIAICAADHVRRFIHDYPSVAKTL